MSGLKADGKENQRLKGRVRGESSAKSGHLNQSKYREQMHRKLWKRKVVGGSLGESLNGKENKGHCTSQQEASFIHICPASLERVTEGTLCLFLNDT